MRILWLSHYIPYPPKAGMLIRSYNLLKELCRENEVHLLAIARPDTLLAMYSSLEEGLADAERHLANVCSRVTFVPTRIASSRLSNIGVALASLLPGPPYTVRWLASREMRTAVAAALHEGSCDLVHCDTISLAQYVATARTPVLALNHHNIESDMLFRRAARDRNPLKKLYFFQEARRLRTYERRMGARFALHITCSDLDTQRLERIDGSLNVHAIPNGVDVDYFSPGADSEVQPATLVFAGGLNWYPNRDAMEYFADEVWPLLSKRHPEVVFDLIGKSPSVRLRDLGRRDGRFRVHGFVDDVRPYLARAAVYVCPIRDGGGTKLKILDALAMGKAIVAHPIAAEGIDVEPERDILFAETAEQFTAQISRLLEDALLRRRIGASARQLAVSRYSFASIGARLRDLYRNAAANVPKAAISAAGRR